MKAIVCVKQVPDTSGKVSVNDNGTLDRASMETITSRQNPLWVQVRKLAAEGKYRRRTGRFLCDSPKLVQEALRWTPETVETMVLPVA